MECLRTYYAQNRSFLVWVYWFWFLVWDIFWCCFDTISLVVVVNKKGKKPWMVQENTPINKLNATDKAKIKCWK